MEGTNTFPDLFLICKILGILLEEYFSFRANWILVSRNNRTIDNLINQLYTCEKVLSNEVVESTAQKTLAIDIIKVNINQSK